MGKPNFSDELKRDAVAQITERGYPVAEVSQRLGVSQHLLYSWKRQLAKVVFGDAGKDAEIRQLKRDLAQVTEERIRRRVYEIREEARRDVFDYIEMFYNPARKQVRNGMLSPAQVERAADFKAEGV